MSIPLLIPSTQELLAEVPGGLIDPTATGESCHADLLSIEPRKWIARVRPD